MNIYHRLDEVALGNVNARVMIEHPNFEGEYPVTRVDPGHDNHGRFRTAIPVLVAEIGANPIVFGEIMDALSQIDPDRPMDRVFMNLQGHPDQGRINVDDSLDIELIEAKDGVVYLKASDDD